MPTIIDLQALGDSPGTVEVVANALLAGDFRHLFRIGRQLIEAVGKVFPVGPDLGFG